MNSGFWSIQEEVFEIVDFTSASEWEVFTSKVEEILLAWNLSVKDKEDVYSPGNISGDWKSSSEDISFAGYFLFLGFLILPITCYVLRLPIYRNSPLGWKYWWSKQSQQLLRQEGESSCCVPWGKLEGLSRQLSPARQLLRAQRICHHLSRREWSTEYWKSYKSGSQFYHHVCQQHSMVNRLIFFQFICVFQCDGQFSTFFQSAASFCADSLQVTAALSWHLWK